MSEFDLSQGCWRLHHMTPVVTAPQQMPDPIAFGGNTDVLLRFTVQNPGFVISEPEQGIKQLFAAQGTWYLGSIVMNDPKHDAWDTDPQRGNYWAKVFPGTHTERHCVLLFQELYALPSTPTTNGEVPVRIFTGQYIAKDKLFFGHGADNWLWELLTFTLTLEACPPS